MKETINNSNKHLKETNIHYNRKTIRCKLLNPKKAFSIVEYRTQLDTLVQCEDDKNTCFQNLISITRWIVELAK